MITTRNPPSWASTNPNPNQLIENIPQDNNAGINHPPSYAPPIIQSQTSFNNQTIF